MTTRPGIPKGMRMHRGMLHQINKHDHVQDVDRDPETKRWRYYCTCGWFVLDDDNADGAARMAASAHFDSTTPGKVS